ncbi:MAG: argininosuccinate lyase [Pseudomonadota bacterium]
MTSNSTSKDTAKGLLRGRFSEATDAFVEEFTASVTFDARMYAQDIAGSIAHARMLSGIGVLAAQEVADIEKGLEQIKGEIEAGTFDWQIPLEDVHMNIESRLIELIGDTGKKLHTGRSRNDQVATDMRLYLRDAIDDLLQTQTELLRALLDLAESHTDTVMPGFTHLQAAQPITFGHHVMAWFEMLHRDRARLMDCRGRVNILPLGAAALAGTPYKPNREAVALELGFDDICRNSLDAVSDRDFIIEFLSVAAITLTHTSRWCEELVLWSSQQFDFVELPDRFCTGSSIMPQKKNPDVPELIRGKTGRVNGHLISLLTLMKSQPLAYNKDNQEDKEPLFDAIDTLSNCMTALLGLVPNIQPKTQNMADAAAQGFTTATDLADYLVANGVAFRDAHEVVGEAVALASRTQRPLEALSIEELKGGRDLPIDEAVYQVLTLHGSVQARDHAGGTAPSQVKLAVEKARARL